MAEKINPFETMSNKRKDNQNDLVAKATDKKPKVAKSTKNTVVAKAPSKDKRGQGRPCKDELRGAKKEYCKNINVAVPKEIMEQVNEYSLKARGMSLTDYINTLISADLKKNLAKYKKDLSTSRYD